MKIYIALVLLAVLFFIGLRPYCEEISIAELSGGMSSMLTVASIIFAVIGAWMAVIFPSALELFKGSGQVGPEKGGDMLIAEGAKKTDHVANLLEVSLECSVVIMSVLFLQLAGPIARKALAPEFFPIVKQGVIFVIMLSAGLLIVSLGRMIYESYYLLSELRIKHYNAKLMDASAK